MNNREVPYIAFIDDCGNPEIDFSTEHVQQAFILTAVVVKLCDLDAVRKKADEIREAFFQTGEMKSDRISDPAKRLQLLKRFQGLQVRFLALVVDKARIGSKSGLQFKPSFVKHFTNKLTFNLHKAYPLLALVADEFGRQEFMNGVRDYMLRRFPIDLWFESVFGPIPKFGFQDSKAEVLLQVADFISGTLLRCYDPKKKDAESGQYLSVIEKKQLRDIDFWPPRNTPEETCEGRLKSAAVGRSNTAAPKPVFSAPHAGRKSCLPLNPV